MACAEIQHVIQVLAKIPGLGQRSARRAVLHLLKEPQKSLEPLLEALQHMVATIRICTQCGNYDMESPCSICKNPSRDKTQMCIVEDVADLWALERTGAFKGAYHVLGGVLSALDGVGPEDLRIPQLLERIERASVQEVILALNATVDGQITNHYLQTAISQYPHVKITALAHGVPLGGELDYLDEGTLMTALAGRRSL